MTDAPAAKRQELKEKIDAAEARNEARSNESWLDTAGEKAVEAKDKFTEFAKEHPVATVAGGVAVGILIAGMFRGPRQAAYRAGTKTAGLAAIGADLAMAYAAKALDAAQDAGRYGADRLDDFGDALGDTARGLKREASYIAGSKSDSARIAARKAGKTVRRTVRNRVH